MISSSTAAEVARGVSRLLLGEGYSPILEFTLPNEVAVTAFAVYNKPPTTAQRKD